MQAGYFQTAWNDIKHSDGWLKKFALLGLLQFIPVFGQIVLMGYLYGWARDIAWNIHAPMPAKIFGNEDGKLYSRGFFILVITFVFSLVAGLVSGIVSGGSTSNNGIIATISSILGIASLLFALLCGVLAWVGSMRSAIYGRIGPGFQLKQIWKMVKYDTNGIMRILGMSLLIGVILGIIFSIIFSVVIMAVGAGAMLSVHGGYGYYGNEAELMMRLLPSMGIGTLFFLLLLYVLFATSSWLNALVARALGYWTRQFDVPSWGGQDAPLPFETGQAAAQAQQAHYAAQVEYAQAQAEYAQAQGQQINQQDAWARQQYAQAAGQQQGQPAGSDVQPGAQNAGYAQYPAQTEPDWISQANAMAPAEQRDPYASAQHAQTTSAAGTAQTSYGASAAPLQPAASSSWAQPETGAAPAQPAADAASLQPETNQFAAGAQSAQPVADAQPAQPAQPTAGAQPAQPAQPAASQVAVGTQPAQPVAGARPVADAKPLADAKPVASSQDMHHRIEAKPAPRWEKIDLDAPDNK